VIEKRIHEVCSEGKQGSIIYKPRTGGGINKQLHLFSQTQVQFLKDSLEKEVHFFGYAA
jgi:hypothetical protein